MSSPRPPEQYQVTPAQFWLMYKNHELYDFVSADHIVMAKKKSDDEPVWCEYRN